MLSIRLGTSAFTAAGWQGTFYPSGMKPRDFLSFYAEHFDTVEVDSTFYRCPSVKTVNDWKLKTPNEFIFSVKVPQTITHDKILANCEAEFNEFVDTMDILQDKIGPMVFQFPYFNETIFKGQSDFLERFTPFLKKLPHGFKFAVEIRNKAWLDERFADLLREYKIALVLQDRSRMPLPDQLKFDPMTADWTYIRWLGDRKGIEQVTKVWNKLVVDRTVQMRTWVSYCHETQKRGIRIYAYANNHYAGYAPATIEMFRDIWQSNGLPELGKPRRLRQESSLFD